MPRDNIAAAWVISDTHFFHDNIVKFQSRDQHIKSLTGQDIDHNDYMVERWNAVVGPDDLILHLGDLYFWRGDGPARFAAEIAPRLNGRKKIILGNHDRDEPQVYEDLGFKVILPFNAYIYGEVVSFDHYPMTPGHIPAGRHIHGHIHLNGYPVSEDWRDGVTATRPRHINVSAEVFDYTPVRVGGLLRATHSGCSSTR